MVTERKRKRDFIDSAYMTYMVELKIITGNLQKTKYVRKEWENKQLQRKYVKAEYRKRSREEDQEKRME